MSEYRYTGIKDFDAVHIFECGQCFRWKRLEDDSYDIAAMGRRVNVRCEGSDLIISPCTEEEFAVIWRDYFDLGTDYGAIKARLCADDPVMRTAAAFGWGIRILRQDLWETIIDFIISQNNNIPRIKGCIERLCCRFGDPLISALQPEGESAGASSDGDPDEEILTHDIPGPQVLASLTEADLAPVRLGYRASYLINTSREILERGMPEDRAQLLALTGVGPKVASCIELFGMNHMDSFPIDVWVQRLMHELYGVEEKNKKAMAAFAAEKFGEYGGIAQQYLFYYEREKTHVQ